MDFNHTKLYTLQRYSSYSVVVVLSATGLLRIAAVEQARIQNHLLNVACHAGDVEYITALLAGHNYSLYRVIHTQDILLVPELSVESPDTRRACPKLPDTDKLI